MPQYHITDPTTGRSVTLTGDSPPTEAELNEIFSKLPKQQAAAQPEQPAQPEGSALGRFASNAWSMVNPVAMVQGAAQAIAHPIDTAGALLKAQGAQIGKAVDAAREGRYSEMAGHAAAGVLPILGPVAADVGEQIGSGDIAGGLGAATGLVGGVLAPGAAAKIKEVKLPAVLANRIPAAVAAIEAGQRAGVPIDAATATGNRFVAAAQHMADRSLGGSAVASKAAEAQARGLATMGEQLAAKGYASPVTVEQAGQGVRDAIHGEIAGQRAEANAAYGALRDIEAAPENARTIHPEPALKREGAPSSFSVKADATVDDIFEGAWKDAKQQGFNGSRSELRSALAEKLGEARRLRADQAATAGEYGHAEFLKSIRELGGLKPFEMDFQQGGPASKLTGEFDSVRQYFGGKGSSSVFRNGGLGLDDMVEQLRQDPRWKHVISSDTDLIEVLDEIGRSAKENGGKIGGEQAAKLGARDLQDYLRAAGAEPGVKWWEAPKQAETMGLPVDIRNAKAALKPVYDDLVRQSHLTQFAPESGKARALDALDRLVNNDASHAPLSRVDSALSDLKSFARDGRAGEVPELANVGQGKAKLAIAHLESAIENSMASAGDAGAAARDALQAGRKATAAKYAAADVLDTLNAEPVRVHGQLTAPKDAAIGKLREVAKQAPGELPKIGRAFLDDLLGQATANGGFEHAQRIASKWENLGAETKRMLYKDPEHIAELDKFFRLAKMTAHNANTSGTASAAHAAAQGAALATAVGTVNPVLAVSTLGGPWAVSKFFHSATGVKLLTKGLRIPIGNAAAKTAYLGELSAFAQKIGASNPNESRMQTAEAK